MAVYLMAKITAFLAPGGGGGGGRKRRILKAENGRVFNAETDRFFHAENGRVFNEEKTAFFGPRGRWGGVCRRF